MDLFKKIAKIGPENAAVLDMPGGKIEGRKGTLVIDNKLIPKLKFIKEGKLKDKGWPTLKLVGDVRPVILKGSIDAGVRVTDDSSAPAVRLEEEQIIRKRYPLDFRALVSKMRERYSDFSSAQRFYNLKKELMKMHDFSH